MFAAFADAAIRAVAAEVDATGRAEMPAFVDARVHLVHVGVDRDRAGRKIGVIGLRNLEEQFFSAVHCVVLTVVAEVFSGIGLATVAVFTAGNAEPRVSEGGVSGFDSIADAIGRETRM